MKNINKTLKVNNKLIMYFIVFILMNNYIFAISFNDEIQGKYEVSYGFFGKLGESKMRVKKLPNNKYIITARAYATGFASYLSNGLKEEYSSSGDIKNGIFTPNLFIKKVTTNNRVRIYKYEFDYKKKVITKYYSSIIKKEFISQDINGFDVRKYKIIKDSSEEKLNFWTSEDILSMFFNIDKYIIKFDKGIIKRLSAVGASDGEKGRIDLIVPDKNFIKKISKDMNEGKNILIVKIYKDIFTSKSGEMYLSLDKNGVCDYVLLKDVFLFGDIRAKLKDYKVK